MFSVIKNMRLCSWFLTGILIFDFANGDSAENINIIKEANIINPNTGQPVKDASELEEANAANSCVSQWFWTDEAFVKDVEKTLAEKPFLKLSCSNINDLCGKALKIVEKFYPEMSSVLSLTLTGFIGGTQCQGEEGTSPVYGLLFLHEKKVVPVFFFKASEESNFFKAVSSLKKDPVDFVKLSAQGAKDQGVKPLAWWMGGEKSLLNVLQTKDIFEEFPFLSAAEKVDNLLQIDFDADILYALSELMPSIAKQLLEVIVKPELKHLRLGFDYLDDNIIINYGSEFQPDCATATLLKGINDKSNQIRHLDVSSQECIKNFGFQDYAGQLDYLSVIHGRLNDIGKAIEENKKQTKTTDEFTDALEQLIGWWNIIYPLLTELENFCKDNLTGNFQSYADVQSSQDFHYETIGFGLFEGKALSNEKLVNFLKSFITVSLVKQLKEAVNQKLFGSELIPELSCVYNKNLEEHKGCSIQNIYWTIGEDKLDKKVPLYFAVCKNYLLYADNIDNIKRLIERIDAIKAFTYVSMTDGFEKTQIRISDFMPLVMKNPVHLDCCYDAKANPAWLNITCKMPLWFNFEFLKNFSNPLLPTPQKNEEIKDSRINTDEKPATLDTKNQQ